MSDGPHRALRARKPWRDATQAADAPAFSDQDVYERAASALRDDWSEEVPQTFMTRVRECFGAHDQLSMIAPSEAETAVLRNLVPGSAFCAVIADCAEDVAARGVTGPSAVREIVEAALEDRVQRQLRHIQEVYQRESTAGRARRVIERMAPALSTAASQLGWELLSRSGRARSAPVTRRTGIDEGPLRP